jgi:hypothetical protein
MAALALLTCLFRLRENNAAGLILKQEMTSSVIALIVGLWNGVGPQQPIAITPIIIKKSPILGVKTPFLPPKRGI